jgi:hypothetical protein
MRERGASEEEVASTLADGERFAAKFVRNGFRRISYSTGCGEVGATV